MVNYQQHQQVDNIDRTPAGMDLLCGLGEEGLLSESDLGCVVGGNDADQSNESEEDQGDDDGCGADEAETLGDET